jgi:iron(III) transport system substrate-binding protein
MKRTLAVLLVLILAAGAGFAGGGKDKGGEDSKVVTVYVAHNADQYNAAIKEFQELTGIEVLAVSMGTGDCLQRIAAESAHPLCDVMWGGTTESLEAYKQYFQPYVSAEDANVPEEFKAKDDLWIGESQQPAVIMYNKNLVSGNDVPVEWADLLNSKWKGKIASANPASSGSAYTLICTMVMAKSQGKNYEQGWKFVEQLAGNLIISGGSSSVYKGVADGEYPLGLTLEQLAYVYVKANPNTVGMIYPKDGSSNVPDGVAMVKNCPNPNNAAKFIDFLLGKQCQQIMSDDFGRRSVRKDINQPGGLPNLSSIYFLDYDFDWAGTGKNDVLARWDKIATSVMTAGK